MAVSVAIPRTCSDSVPIPPSRGFLIGDGDPWTQSVPIARGWSVGTKAVTVPGNASIL
ncbi:hypothetical protein NG799_01040 [Laspinema sp. D1]|uniref:Uncharacterized protein n=1 Tax=Laspinema palackyanum D2a TaxID=2953684 RepID=A0ABT2MJJ9_9CYAN|nr:hypothetical protein [Laspinema sp. D2b]MCT7964915.1 hypothetical protein [Laspinema sp. D2a]